MKVGICSRFAEADYNLGFTKFVPGNREFLKRIRSMIIHERSFNFEKLLADR